MNEAIDIRINPTEIVYALAEKLSQPDLVRSQTLSEENQSQISLSNGQIWSDLSMSGGFPGIMLLFTELESTFSSDKWEKIVHQYALAIGEALKKGLPGHYSLFGGLAGICYAFDCASQGGSRYKNILSKLHSFLLGGIENAYLKPLERNLRVDSPSSPFTFDIIMGVAGPLLYLSTCHKRDESIKICEHIVTTLLKLTDQIDVMGYSVPGWYTACEDQFLEEDKLKFAKGNFNLGVAHGIAGVLGTLAYAWEHGIRVEGQMEAMQNIGNWLIDQSTSKEDLIYWRDRISFEEYVGIEPRKQISTRAAWCYGTPGVARILYQVGSKLGNRTWQETGLKAYKGIFTLPREKWHIFSPTFCHGLAGLYLITHLMASDSGDLELHARSEQLKKELLHQYSPEYLFGFQDLQPQSAGAFLASNTPGLLEGATGITLALLHDQIKSPRWHHIFLLG